LGGGVFKGSDTFFRGISVHEISPPEFVKLAYLIFISNLAKHIMKLTGCQEKSTTMWYPGDWGKKLNYLGNINVFNFNRFLFPLCWLSEKAYLIVVLFS